MLASNLMDLVTCDAFYLANRFLTQPLMIVADDKANTLWFSEDLYRKAASVDKILHVVEGATHIGLYDHRADDALDALVPFFQGYL
ncbi:MAG: alpha/beta hydrolase [Propionibacteriaceae bacterium]|nr:alpha/beta hydrolase [Propionibacteriaceae bacterium]